VSLREEGNGHNARPKANRELGRTLQSQTLRNLSRYLLDGDLVVGHLAVTSRQRWRGDVCVCVCVGGGGYYVSE
jgi:hypothetical protein